MTVPPAPLRFVGAVVGGWIALRALALAPDWPSEPLPHVAAAERPAPVPAAADPSLLASEPAPGWALAPQAAWARLASSSSGTVAFRSVDGLRTDISVPFELAGLTEPLRPAPADVAQLFPPARPRARSRRWSGSAWIFVRNDMGAPALVPAGELGGSQAGARLTYRLLGRRSALALSGRLYMPLERPEGAEAAVGIDWRPLPRLPINILAERREALGRDGRSDFALTLYGGGERRLGPVRVEAWGQAGAVGLEHPDLFADGLVRATVRAGPVDVGGGIWGGAQPGAARLDAGPHVSGRVPVKGVNLRLMGEWRFRVAGDAAPGSGPAFTLASDF